MRFQGKRERERERFERDGREVVSRSSCFVPREIVSSDVVVGSNYRREVVKRKVVSRAREERWVRVVHEEVGREENGESAYTQASPQESPVS